MILSVLCYYYFFSGYNIKSEILLSIVCDLKKKNSRYNIKSEIFSVFCVSKIFVFLGIIQKVNYYWVLCVVKKKKF